MNEGDRGAVAIDELRIRSLDARAARQLEREHFTAGDRTIVLDARKLRDVEDATVIDD